MGQQQLLLLVLTVMIVGTAIIVGIRTFRENSIRANADVLSHAMLSIAKDAMIWKQKPSQFGGQDEGSCKSDPTCFKGINFRKLGYRAKGNPFQYVTPEGEFHIVERKDAFGIKACNTSAGNKLIVEFRGFEPDSVVLVYEAIGTDTGCKD